MNILNGSKTHPIYVENAMKCGFGIKSDQIEKASRNWALTNPFTLLIILDSLWMLRTRETALLPFYAFPCVFMRC